MNKVEANKYLLNLAEVRKQYIDSDSEMPDEVKAILMGAKALELVAKMEQDYEALKNKIPKVNLTESYQYCFLTEYLEVNE